MKDALVTLWDKTTRILHWTIAIAVVLNLFLLEEGDPPHEWVGYAAVSAVVIRFIWGFFGSEASRFRNFPVSPKQIKRFALGLFRGEKLDYPGHNPLASLSYFGIWTLILALGVSGFMMGLDAFWGEEWLEELHEAFSMALQLLVSAHFVGMGLDSLKFKRKTYLAMLTGRK